MAAVPVSALQFEVLGTWNKARASILTLPHHTVKTPVFMPVGTQGSIKGLTSHQVHDVGVLFHDGRVDFNGILEI